MGRASKDASKTCTSPGVSDDEDERAPNSQQNGEGREAGHGVDVLQKHHNRNARSIPGLPHPGDMGAYRGLLGESGARCAKVNLSNFICIIYSSCDHLVVIQNLNASNSRDARGNEERTTRWNRDSRDGEFCSVIEDLAHAVHYWWS